MCFGNDRFSSTYNLKLSWKWNVYSGKRIVTVSTLLNNEPDWAQPCEVVVVWHCIIVFFIIYQIMFCKTLTVINSYQYLT